MREANNRGKIVLPQTFNCQRGSDDGGAHRGVGAWVASSEERRDERGTEPSGQGRKGVVCVQEKI